MAKAHRRLGEAEHAVERRMKGVADEVPDEQGFREAAEDLSARADRHLVTADEIERRAAD